ncbi:ninjurin-2-like [Argopecten irradians]|uniref:ninjurin-2-like n=1 Tax=Argopecten irradians TaxID=31199 RepID=UPI0037220530
MDEESVRSEGSSVVYRHISRIMSKNYYSKMKTLAEGLMDIGLMTANASQLKAVIDVGPTHRYYSTLLPLIITSLVLQVLVGVLVLVLFTDDEDGENLRCKRINNVVVGVIFYHHSFKRSYWRFRNISLST